MTTEQDAPEPVQHPEDLSAELVFEKFIDSRTREIRGSLFSTKGEGKVWSGGSEVFGGNGEILERLIEIMGQDNEVALAQIDFAKLPSLDEAIFIEAFLTQIQDGAKAAGKQTLVTSVQKIFEKDRAERGYSMDRLFKEISHQGGAKTALVLRSMSRFCQIREEIEESRQVWREEQEERRIEAKISGKTQESGEAELVEDPRERGIKAILTLARRFTQLQEGRPALVVDVSQKTLNELAETFKVGGSPLSNSFSPLKELPGGSLVNLKKIISTSFDSIMAMIQLQLEQRKATQVIRHDKMSTIFDLLLKTISDHPQFQEKVTLLDARDDWGESEAIKAKITQANGQGKLVIVNWADGPLEDADVSTILGQPEPPNVLFVTEEPFKSIDENATQRLTVSSKA